MGCRRLTVAAVAAVLGVQVLGVVPALGQRVANPSGPFTLTVQNATLQIRDETFDFSNQRQPQCSDGRNNDEDLLGGSPQDSSVDFPADGQCTSAADDSEVQGGFQSLQPVTLAGTIGADGAWNVPTGSVSFPRVYLFARPPVIGGTVITVTVSATHAATGNLNPLTGAATLRVRLRVDLDGSGLGSDCHVGDSGNPIDINAFSTAATSGVPYSADTGGLTLANHTFAVPGASGCSTFPINVNNEINDALGLPSPSGQNHAVFAGTFPAGAKPLRAVTANLDVNATVACRRVTFSAAGSTFVQPVSSFAFDYTNDGVVDQSGLLTTASTTFATAGTRQARLRVTDSQGDFHERLVSYTVGINLAPIATDQNRPRSAAGAAVPLTLSGSDPEGGPLTFAVTAPPAHGTLSGTPPNLTYTPSAGFGGPDSFTFAVTDDCGNSDLGTVTLDVNRVPDAHPQAVTTDQEVPAAVTLTATDGDGDPLTFAVTSSPASGTLSGTAPNLTYTPDTGFFGTDGFSFSASDGFGGSDSALVTIQVIQNTPPDADDQSVTTAEDTPTGITLTGSDADLDPLTFSVTDAPDHGSLAGSGPNLTYTPAPDYHGPDGFTFSVHDGRGGSGAGAVSIIVTPVEDPPAAADQSVSVVEDTSAPITLTGSDPDGDTLGFGIASPPAHGVLSGALPNLTYTPAAGYTGPDAFTFTVDDGHGNSDTGTVTITVTERNDPPVPDSQVLDTPEDTSVAVTLGGSDPEGAPVTVTVLTQPAHGTLGGAVPDLTYTPAPEYSGPDEFTFRVEDPQGASATGTIDINVLAVNDAPQAAAQTVSTSEDVAVATTLTASDADDPAGDLVFQVTSLPAHGTVTGTGAAVTYTPAPNFHGSDSFQFRVRDPQGAESVATVSVAVAPVNDPPVAHGQAVSTPEDASVAVALSGTDVDGDALAFSVVSGPAHGTLSGPAPNLSYLPVADFHGFDSFVFEVADGHGGTATATVTIAVLAGNDAPVALAQSVTTPEDVARAITLGGSDVDGDALAYAIEVGPAHGTLSGTAPAITYTPDTNYTGADSLVFSVRDPHGLTSTATVSISVTPVPLIATEIDAKPVVAEVRNGTWFYPRLTAVLTRADTDAPLAGRVIRFFVQAKQVCQAVTNGSGTATCGGSANSAVLASSYSARFAGDADFSASQATGQVTR